ncbi:condensin subunit Smc [Hydrogenispora ethanolica]|uniref:Chromosome partition protein Smc n=1 Tax=Hydrogenispora ethanolica TaxID=1082276 RepID=A0A4R1QZ87_HYDET|nr:chromosome segregation protein SMC [Hydrogenispora ethanolica]TCL58305.1 condensin subunit Smc [Hydrogenispora ethanolica]
MYLKRLEIVGFKSFADKTRLEIPSGVTAVVGPNGSGKSNISDALRWVLGEQSIKTLRGSKMDDVIFAGSDQRRPLGLAEVSIVLDNSDHSIPVDFTEIAVTRKLFRSGESDYLINKSSVRLKDVQELFFDTGLGKEAYSVIGQGKIDSILSVKAEDRRAIFEEAAGINKYKTRKMIAERKLEETDRNLLRVQDILQELAGQLGPLESQAALAEKYLALRQQLSQVEIHYFGALITRLQTELNGIIQTRTELDAAFQDFEGQENIIEAEIEAKRYQLLEHDNQLTQFNEEYYRLQNQIDKFAEQVNFLQEKLSDLDRQQLEQQNGLETGRQRQAALREQQGVLETEITAIRQQVEAEGQLLQEQESVLATFNQQLATFEATEQSVKNDYIETLNQIAALKNKINSAELQKDFIQKQVSECRRKQEILEKQLAQSENEAESRQQDLSRIEAELSHCQQTMIELSSRNTRLEQEVGGLERKNREWQDKARGLESKIALLDEMERSYQGYFQGVKSLLAEAVREPFYASIKGIIADLIQVRPGMELAIETALGSNLQNVVIESDRQAEAAITFLKKHNKGRATFLPLNTIQGSEGRVGQYQVLLAQHGCHTALSLLTFDPLYRQALAYLIGQTVVAPDLRTAIQIGQKLDRSIRTVTPEGDLVIPGGAITGGSVDKRRLGLLSRRREIEDLKAEKTAAEAELQKGMATAAGYRQELQQNAQTAKDLMRQENEAKIQKATVAKELSNLQLAIEKTHQEQRLHAEQLQELAGQCDQFELGQGELAQSMAEKEQALRELEHQLSELAGQMKAAKEQKEALIQGIGELRSSLSAKRQAEQGKNALKGQLDKQLAELLAFFAELDNKLAQFDAERLKIRETIAATETKTAAIKEQLQTQESLIERNKHERATISQAIKELETKQRSLRRKSNEFQNQLHRLELQANQKQMEIENFERNLDEDYGSDWSTQYDPAWELPEEPERRIEEYKSQLRDLGTVNIAAIEDFRQVKERFEFLTDQSQDLTKAKESLLKVIYEIERTIIKKFNETFATIRDQFRQIFGELFAGGNADLYLLEPDSPLESGIEIIAQPPGKKLQSLSLLSGGERAMTAISLLFAILAVKPSPFCVLDEIDATLDEVNVERFSHLLEMFSHRLQFIVITHRRGTMEAATALYGVTMEEMGVSKLISLDLNEKVG